MAQPFAHGTKSNSSADSLRGRTILLTFWLPLALAFAVEFLIFDQIGAKRHTWIYPRWNDQIQYLTESYTGYEFLKLHGFWRGLWQTLINPSAQGTLHDFFAVGIFSVTGPSRSAALSLNLLALIVWQGALAAAVLRGTASRSLAWAAAALPLALAWPWNNWAGSTADFRLDHMGMCAFGVALAAAFSADGFRSLRGSILFGVAIGLALLVRFITGPYFVVMYAALFIWLLCSKERARRSGLLLLSGLIALAFAGPVFWLNREWVWNYYWIGHFTGPESAIRNPNMGLSGSLAFVWGELYRKHLGTTFLWLAGSGFAVLVIGAWIGRNTPATPSVRSQDWLKLSLFFLFAPAVVLTLHQQKSEIVLGALVPGVIGVVIGTWIEIRRRGQSRWSVLVLAVGSALVGAWYFNAQQRSPAYDQAFANDARKVSALADYVYARSGVAKLANPKVAVDQVTDCLDAQIMRVICYERHRVWMPLVMTLPTGIWKEKEALLFERLAQSDFVFITESGPVGAWPYDEQLAALRPQTKAWCEQHLRLVERFTIFGKHMALYQRPEIPLP